MKSVAHFTCPITLPLTQIYAAIEQMKHFSSGIDVRFLIPSVSTPKSPFSILLLSCVNRTCDFAYLHWIFSIKGTFFSYAVSVSHHYTDFICADDMHCL